MGAGRGVMARGLRPNGESSSGALIGIQREGSGGSGRLGSSSSINRGSSLQQRISTARPFSARPGTATSLSRPGTAAGSAPPSASSGGLYWRKNRLGSGGSASPGPGGALGILGDVARMEGVPDDDDDGPSSSSLTFGVGGGSGGPMTGSMARNRRKAASAAAACGVAGGGGAAGRPLSADTGVLEGGRLSSVSASTDTGLTGLRGSKRVDSSLLLQQLCSSCAEDETAETTLPWDSGPAGDARASGEVDRMELSEGGPEEGAPDVLQLHNSTDGSGPLPDGLGSYSMHEHLPDAQRTPPRSPACSHSASVSYAEPPRSPAISRSASQRDNGRPPLASRPGTGSAPLKDPPAQGQAHSSQAPPLPRGPSKMMLHKVLRDQHDGEDAVASSSSYLGSFRPASGRSSIGASSQGRPSSGEGGGTSSDGTVPVSVTRPCSASSREIELRQMNPKPVPREDEPDSDDDLFADLDD
eukprot:gene10182-8088_t